MGPGVLGERGWAFNIQGFRSGFARFGFTFLSPPNPAWTCHRKYNSLFVPEFGNLVARQEHHEDISAA